MQAHSKAERDEKIGYYLSSALLQLICKAHTYSIYTKHKHTAHHSQCVHPWSIHEKKHLRQKTPNQVSLYCEQAQVVDFEARLAVDPLISATVDEDASLAQFSQHFVFHT